MAGLTGKQLAEHWGVSAPYISKLKKKHGLDPSKLTSLDEADAWRAAHSSANPLAKRGKAKSTKKPSVKSKVPTPTSTALTPIEFDEDGDMDDMVLKQAFQIVQVAYNYYLNAVNKDAPERIAYALKNWSDTSRSAADARKRWLDNQLAAKTQLSVDDLKAAIGPDLAEAKRLLHRLPSIAAPKANPSDPDLAKRVITQELERVWKSMDTSLTRAELKRDEG